MKRPTMLFRALLAQANIDLDLAVDRDAAYLQHRFEHEGLSFLTITLPTLCDAFESGIESGLFSCPSNFARHGRLPLFLGGFFKRVFHSDGSLLSSPCVESIHWIRQITRFFKKPRLSCTPSRERKAITKYLETEDDLRRATNDVERIDNTLDHVANILWSRVFLDFDPQLIVCGHGPGATAESLPQNGRRKIRQWPIRSEESYPVCDHAFHNYWEAAGYGYSEGVNGIKALELRDEPPVRVVFVPKTLSSPRVIAIEPSHMQFMQQGLSRYMVSAIESHRLTRHSVRFSDQGPNQTLARVASRDRSLTTMDLSEASDRVHLHLVQRLFKNSPILHHLEDARSLHATLPNGQNVVLVKYASMGSALCFPVEACVFYTLVLSAIFHFRKETPTASRIERLSRKIAVYGDDIIVPVQYAAAVMSYLESYALRVNRHKTFSNSLFRESCGGDFFNGESVKPIYAREMFPESRHGWDQKTLSSWVSTANQFYEAGKWYMAQKIRDLILSDLGNVIPRSRNPGNGLTFSSYLYNTNLSYDSRLCCYKQKRIVYSPIKRKDSIHDIPQACFNRTFERTSHQWKASQVLLQSLFRDDEDSDSGVSRLVSEPGVPIGTEPCALTPEYLGARSCKEEFLREGESLLLSNFMVHSYERPKPGLLSSTSVDFDKSVKRGAFKSKRQWIAMVSL